MKLKVVEDYKNRGEFIPKGRVIDVTEVQARWYMADAPGCFEVVATKRRRGRPKAVKEPPENKMVVEAEDK